MSLDGAALPQYQTPAQGSQRSGVSSFENSSGFLVTGFVSIAYSTAVCWPVHIRISGFSPLYQMAQRHRALLAHDQGLNMNGFELHTLPVEALKGYLDSIQAADWVIDVVFKSLVGYLSCAVVRELIRNLLGIAANGDDSSANSTKSPRSLQ